MWYGSGFYIQNIFILQKRFKLENDLMENNLLKRENLFSPQLYPGLYNEQEDDTIYTLIRVI